MKYGNYPDLTRVKKILVIKLRHHGDVLLTSPVFSNLQAAIPQAEIHAMVYQDTIPMLDGHPAIQKFLAYNRDWKKLGLFWKVLKEFSLLKRVRKEKYDLVINLTEGDRGAIAAFVSGAKICVGIDPEGKGFRGKRKIYSHIVKNCKTPRHTVEKNLDALRRIGIFPTAEERDLFFAIPEESKKRVEKLHPRGYFLLHPVSRWKFKCWPTSLVAKLIRDLHQRGEKIVITASPDTSELQMVDEILKLAPEVPVLNLAGKTSLKDLGALIAMSRCLVCVDSVPLHMSSALKIPTVVLFGPTSEINWGPWQNPKARVVVQNLPCRPCFMDGCGGSKKSDCLLTLPVSRVLSAIDTLAHEPARALL
ncbi:MAG TPA: putative lipopolysaccharide heptosyltransferase III [Rhabdochlamydiaceae bacterium]|jgi:heptosyltransferase-3|nr:putative lipopolysaccharide heptosyltransferase III [Rhabdochlamydiaceae bacterium]